MSMPEPPRDHYLWLGRVMNACSMLELQVGMIGWASKNQEVWTENWSLVAGRPGAAWALCRAEIGRMEPAHAAEVEALLVEAQVLREERNRFAHAVFILDPMGPMGGQWILRSARDEEFQPLTEERGAALVVQANRLSRRASELRQNIARRRRHSP